MNLYGAATSITSGHERHHEVETQLHGCWLIIARSIWVTLVILTLAIFVIFLPPYFAQLQTPCTGPICALVQPTAATVRALRQIGLSVSAYATFTLVFTIVTASICFLVGGVIFWRKSDDWMALLAAFAEVSSGTLFVTYALLESHSSWQALAIFSNVFGHAVFFLFTSLFPNGRFVPRWSGWITVVWLIWSLLYYTVLHYLPFTYHTLALIIGLFFALLAQVYRYRYVASPAQRQQIKWVVLASSLAAVMVIVLDVPTLILPLTSQTGSFYRLFVSGPVDILAVLLVALSLGIAILRYRLWEIDVLINRALVYVTLTVMLALLYVGLVIGLQSLVHLVTGTISEQPFIIVASTLAIATLFQPLRRRVQTIIDRRFYRRKYDAARTLAAFSASLSTDVDIDQLSVHLIAVVEETMQPIHGSLWIRPPEHNRKLQGPSV